MIVLQDLESEVVMIWDVNASSQGEDFLVRGTVKGALLGALCVGKVLEEEGVPGGLTNPAEKRFFVHEEGRVELFRAEEGTEVGSVALRKV